MKDSGDLGFQGSALSDKNFQLGKRALAESGLGKNQDPSFRKKEKIEAAGFACPFQLIVKQFLVEFPCRFYILVIEINLALRTGQKLELFSETFFTD